MLVANEVIGCCGQVGCMAERMRWGKIDDAVATLELEDRDAHFIAYGLCFLSGKSLCL